MFFLLLICFPLLLSILFPSEKQNIQEKDTQIVEKLDCKFTRESTGDLKLP